MKAEQQRHESTLTEHWTIRLSGAPEFDFGWGGRTAPHSAMVKQTTRTPRGRDLAITLNATAHNGWSISRSWVSPTPANPRPRASWEGDPPGNIDDLPAELVQTILAACGGITVPEPKEPTP